MEDAINPGAWDDAAFCSRVEVLATERGRDVREVCRSAGLAPDYLNKPASRNGRAIGHLLRLAQELAVPVIRLIEAGDPEGAASSPVDRDVLGRLALTANVAAHLYVNLDNRRGVPVRSEAERIVQTIISLLDFPPETDSERRQGLG